MVVHMYSVEGDRMAVSSWLAHGFREPSQDMLSAMHEWWREAASINEPFTHDPGLDECVWQRGPLHTLVQLHVDRAAHKRRRRVLFVSHNPCAIGSGNHGTTAMSSVIADDPYGPEALSVEHSHPTSALDYAFDRVERDAGLLAITLMTEGEFEDPDFYHQHSSSRLKALKGGVVLPFLMVPHAKDLLADKTAAADREDMLRAHGFSSYTIDVDLSSASTDSHRDLANLLEDVCGEIAGIKADAFARVLSHNPRWPLIVLRSVPTWEHARERAD